MKDNFKVVLPDWKDVPITFSGLHYNTMQKGDFK